MNVIREIKQRRPEIQARVNFIPIVPFLGDDERNMGDVVAGAKMVGADFVLFGGGMTLRDNQASWFMRSLSEEFPQLVEEYRKLCQAKYTLTGGYRGRYDARKSYLKRIHRKTLDPCDRHQLAFSLKRYTPEDFRKHNYLVAQ